MAALPESLPWGQMHYKHDGVATCLGWEQWETGPCPDEAGPRQTLANQKVVPAAIDE